MGWTKTGTLQNSTYNLDPHRYDSTRLRALKAALAKADTTPVDFLFLGDSYSEEPSIAGDLSSTNPGYRWVTRFARRARNIYQPPLIWGGPGYYGYSDWMPAVTYAGTTALIDHMAGLQRRAVQMQNTATATFVVPGTGVDFYYLKGAEVGTFTWKVNSGSETTVNATQASPDTAVLQLRAANGIVPGCTVTIKATSASPTYSLGFFVYDGDEAAGLRFWCGAHSGYTAKLYNSDPYALGDPNKMWSLIDPDCVIMGMGLGDYIYGTDTPAQMKTQLETLVASVRSHCTKEPSIIMFMQPDTAAVDGGPTPLATMAEYRQAMEDFAKADGKITLLDFSKVFGTSMYPGPDTYEITLGDNIHPNNYGWQIMADEVSKLVFGGLGPQLRPRKIPNTTTLHSTQLALMPTGTTIEKYTP